MEFLIQFFTTYTSYLIVISVIISIIVWSNKWLMQYGMNREFLAKGDYMSFAKQIGLYQFIHGDILHLVMNSYFLYSAGPILESILGSVGFIIFFVITTIVNVIALYVFAPRSNTIGISGFCMALLAYLWILMYMTGNPGAGQIGILLVINIALGFAPGISLVGHAAGAITGIAFFFVMNSII